MKHVKTYESFSQNEYIVDEGFKEFGRAITKPFRQSTTEEVEEDALEILNNPSKIGKIESILKNSNNPIHYENYEKTKSEYESGNEMPFFNFLIFVKDNLDELRNNTPIYYKIDYETGEVIDTSKYSYSTGPGGRTWSE